LGYLPLSSHNKTYEHYSLILRIGSDLILLVGQYFSLHLLLLQYFSCPLVTSFAFL